MKFSGVSDLQGVKVLVFPLTLLVIVTTVLRYRAACDDNTHTERVDDWQNFTFTTSSFLADRNNGRAIGAVLRLSSVCDVMYSG